MGLDTGLCISGSMSSHDTGQLLLVGVPGYELDAETAAFFKSSSPAGTFSSAATSSRPSNCANLIDDLRDLSHVEPIDHHRPGRRPRLPPEAHRQRTAQRPATPRQERSRPHPKARRYHRPPAASVRFQPRSLPCPRHFLRRRSRQLTSKGRCYGRTVAEVIEKASAFNAALQRDRHPQLRQTFPRLLLRRPRSAPRAAQAEALQRRHGSSTNSPSSATSPTRSTA